MVKTFVADHEALNEARNMNFLKQSLINWSIAIHDAIIGRDEGDHIRISIILPWASLGDLSQFLVDGTYDTHQGHVEHYYNFAEKFPHVKKGQRLVQSLLGQSAQLAGALRFLHEGFDTKQDDWHVRCTHMDLKPANILIFPSSPASGIVGKWKISDFGISVLRARQKAAHSQKTGEMGSLGDYFSRIQANFRPSPGRHLGTFQAPEFEFPLEYASMEDAKDVQRKSAVWSFGAILAEVLAYAFGRSASVREFRERRLQQSPRRGFPDNLFYTPGPDNDPSHCFLRAEVARWLDEFRYKTPHPPATGCLKCWGSVVKRILVVDAEARPDASQVERWLRELQHHIAHPGEKPCLEPDAPIPRYHVSPSLAPQSPYLDRHLSGTSLTPSYDGPYARIPDGSGRPRSPWSPSFIVGPETEASTCDEIQPSQRLVSPEPTPALPLGRRSSGTTSSSGVRDSLTLLSATRSSESSHISLNSKDVIDYDLDAAGGKLAYLTKSGVEIFQLTPAEELVTPRDHGLIKIDGKKQDYRICVSGQYLVVWGYINKRLEASGQRSIPFTSAPHPTLPKAENKVLTCTDQSVRCVGKGAEPDQTF